MTEGERHGETDAVDAIVELLIDADWHGVRTYEVSERTMDATRLARILGPRLESIGFETCSVRSGRTHGLPTNVSTHVCLVGEADSTNELVDVIWQLALASPRPHLIVRSARWPGRRRAHCLVAGERDACVEVAALLERSDWIGASRRGLSVLRRERRRCFRLSALTSAGLREQGQLEQAESVLSAVRAEAWLVGESLPGCVREEHARLLRSCGRWEEAERAMADRSKLVRGRTLKVERFGTYLTHTLPELLQLIQDADDHRAALDGCCRWAKSQAHAIAAAIVSSDGVVLASHGEGARTAWSSAARGAPDPPNSPLIVSPIRYGGLRVAVVILETVPERARSAREAADALAAVAGPAVRERLDELAAAAASRGLMPEIIGRSPSMAGLRDQVVRAAAAPFSVLIEGESGTGKELVARAIHRLSSRRDRPFCALNCAALSDDLFEAEVFGHARGAFTGAHAARTGLFESASNGTLFLDEVSELSPRAQAKLLRAIQEREVRRVGENSGRRVDVRLVAASNRPLAASVKAGLFREDLLFRLAVVRLRLPALRDRVEDIPLIAHAIWRDLAMAAGKRAELSPDAVAALCRRPWPGNVRELQNTLATLVLLAPARGRVSSRHVARMRLDEGEEDESQTHARPLELVRRDSEQRAVASALARHGGRRLAAARELGLTRQGLAKAIKRLGLDSRTDSVGVA